MLGGACCWVVPYIGRWQADVNVKIKKAYCPPGKVEGNPCVAYVTYIVLPWFGKFVVERSEANGGNT